MHSEGTLARARHARGVDQHIPTLVWSCRIELLTRPPVAVLALCRLWRRRLCSAPRASYRASSLSAAHCAACTLSSRVPE